MSVTRPSDNMWGHAERPTNKLVSLVFTWWCLVFLWSNYLCVNKMADSERSFLFDLVSTQLVITGVLLLVVCWLVVRCITTGRQRRVSDYGKKFDPVDVSTKAVAPGRGHVPPYSSRWGGAERGRGNFFATRSIKKLCKLLRQGWPIGHGKTNHVHRKCTF